MDFRVSVPGYIREASVPKIPFPRPVSIFVGLGFPREIDSVLEAYQLLNEWPQTTRGPKHLDALHNCAAVLGRRGSARDARRAFEAFAADRARVRFAADERKPLRNGVAGRRTLISLAQRTVRRP